MRQDSKNPAQGMHQDEIALDGVRYANLHQAGQQWRIGAVSPAWRQELLALPVNPDSNDLARLEDRGLWIAPVRDEGVPPLAVMCGGLGAVWPGMGRELYDNFPAARAAMDRLAAVADWDILGLMDETDVEKISPTRWQSPYVFMLEYAQWSVLASLGLNPALFCGHSLGEMIGLCVSGMIEPEVAWYIIDTRAVHMGEMEARATRETGMMAVHADMDTINEACATWPALYVSNYNTPNQFILSGPREVLQEARKSLRKRRIPAIVLNVSLAFHHPSMRVLRDISLRRLSALDMHAPTRPLMSCIDAQFYPGDPASTYTHIADLDENSVRWTECVHTMWNREGIRTFLELGPQDTLCSLVTANEPQARCFSVGRKGREVEGLRQACARLYSLGYLSREGVEARARAAGGDARLLAAKPAPHCGLRPVAPQSDAVAETIEISQPVADVVPLSEPEAAAAAAAAASYADSLAAVLQILAQASGRPVEDLRPEMDLRYDLALRSSRFPLIVQDVEKALGISVNFEDLLQVSTVGDLARVLSGGGLASGGQGEASAEKVSATVSLCAEPLRRYAPLEALPAPAEHVYLEPLALAPRAAGLNLQAGDVLALCVLDTNLLPRLLSGIAPLGCVLAVPQPLLEQCQVLVRAGARLVPLNINPAEWAESAQAGSQLRAAIAVLAAEHGRVDGLFFVPPVPAGIMVASSDAQGCALADADLGDLLQAALDAALPHGLRFASTVTVMPPASENCFFDAPLDRVLEAAGQSGLDVRGIRMLHGPERASLDEWGDMFARELLCGTAPHVVWARPGLLLCSTSSSASGSLAGSVVCHEPEATQFMRTCPEQFPLVFPDPAPPYRPMATLFQGCCHYSRFADTPLATHGAQSGNALGATVPTLPVCRSLSALLEGARQCLPWLKVSGFCDLRFFDAPKLAPGITRECRVTTEAEPWQVQEKVMTRMCRSTLSVRGLTPNGRHTAQYTPVSEGMVWLAAHRSEVRPLGIDAPLTASPNGMAGGTPGDISSAAGYYAAAGLGAEWRLVDNFAALPDALYTAALRLPQPCIAPGLDCGYTDDMLVVEGVVQTAWLAITSEYSRHFDDAAAMAEAMESWRLHAVGFIRIGDAPASGPLHVLMKRSWSAKRLRRFDAQVVDQTGTVFLTIHHLEFDRCDRAGLASAQTPSI